MVLVVDNLVVINVRLVGIMPVRWRILLGIPLLGGVPLAGLRGGLFGRAR